MYKKITIIVLVLVLFNIFELWIIRNDYYLLNRTLLNSIRGIQLNIEIFLKNYNTNTKQENLEQLYLSVYRNIDTINKISENKSYYKDYSLKYLGYAIEDMTMNDMFDDDESIALLKDVCSKLSKIERTSSSDLKKQKNIKIISNINNECKEKGDY